MLNGSIKESKNLFKCVSSHNKTVINIVNLIDRKIDAVNKCVYNFKAIKVL